MCKCWNNVYCQLLSLNASLPAVEQVSRYLNLPIDLNKRREMGNLCRDINSDEREIARKVNQAAKVAGASCAMYAVDTIPLKLCDVGFHYRVLNYDMTVEGSLAAEAKSELKGAVNPMSFPMNKPKSGATDTCVFGAASDVVCIDM